ncbi:MAG: hypothetical protein NZ602_12695 [Thermoguttaceae bacterium]|nr:hypothetical protein [Thermoguttaceae bacterium]MDW8039640.1 hypothetical protein [Thermoguttaceae bacterium]
MSQTVQEAILAVWQDLPDPTDPAAPKGQKTQMVVPVSTWHHILEKHIRCELEPWSELLTESVRQALIDQPVEASEQTAEGQQALRRLETEVRHSLERPLVLLYAMRPVKETGQAGETRYRVWGMVLPSGATAYAHQKGGKVELMTCYFPKPCGVKTNRDQRWQKTVKTLLWRYCSRSADNRGLCYPDETYQVLVRPEGEEPQYRTRIRFVTWQTWGFLSGEPGSPWRGRLEPWPAAEPPQAQNRKPHRLRPWKTD